MKINFAKTIKTLDGKELDPPRTLGQISADALLNRPTTYSFKNSDTTSPAVRAGQYQRRRADAWYDSQIKELNP